jgi:S-DNA-T family DNA segregation ATPase FtsK/SpoIIIE
LLDGYGSFTSVFERIDFGEWIEKIPLLVTEGRALGIHFVITADRRTAVNMALSGSITARVILRMAEDDEYSSLGLDARITRGTVLPPGRGFVGATVEFQAALVGDEPSGEAQAEALTTIGRALRQRHGDHAAPDVRSLPVEVRRDEMPVGEPLHATVGIGQRDLEPVSIDLFDGNVLVAGPNRSGRSTVLGTLATSLSASTPGVRLYLLAPRKSPLLDLDVWAQVARGVSECEDLARELAEMIDERDGRETPIVVIVDDGTELTDSGADGALERLVRRGRDVGISLLGAAESTSALRCYSGWVPEIRKDRRAILLNPDSDIDGDLVAVKLPRRASGGMPPGRGYLVYDGAVELVQCAG